MEITVTLGTILLLIILVTISKPNFFNFGTVINNYGKEPEQISGEEKKELKDVSDRQDHVG